MLNKSVVMGRFTRDPELKKTEDGVSVCGFTLAVERDSPAADGTRGCDFINVICWRNFAETIVRNFHKGKPIIVVGRLQTSSWKNKNGETRWNTEIRLEEFYFVGKKEQPASDEFPVPEEE